ncbi:fimbrial biogenesis chaperone [Brevundimonas lenta]|uniref:P pilus assembly chaperone PapD n=1 Tax=Brevundimonas lenta TaxID=424796 RepID=A0A7W6JFS7_9CAUL|nr:fimbria/pilus periplasmic chaperone [Brevundimonas lenta]MBB4084281.1 P pilus assembly chaperone PapD [Brevundimonas lenta]
MFKRFALLVLALSTMAGAAHAQVGADLNISPKRVVFGPGERSATVYIFNQGDQPATYTVELVDRVMLPDGQILPATDRPDVAVSSALELVQYTPRRITLQPRESQAIRVRARPGADAAGEYRSHLTVTALPPETTGFTAEQAASAGTDELALQVVALFSVSIPVIVRDAAPDARAALSALSVERVEGVDLIGLDIERLGPSSVYGDIEVRVGEDPSAPLLTAVRGVAVYPEVDRRRVLAALPAPLQPGTVLNITYRDDDARPGEVLATARLVVP